jgi:outer membrane protein G
MKKTVFILALIASVIANAQIFAGKGDQKVQIGADFQSGATGIQGTYDYGLADNFSMGLGVNYALGLDDNLDADFDDRATIKLRFNANIGNVINIDPMLDIYPGLAFSTKNFGGHLGARYFFTDGFGVFTEAAFPLAKYKTEALSPVEEIHNQFNINFGLAFNF